MSIKELKRLNVISEFENAVDASIRNKDHNIMLNCPDGKECFVFQVSETLLESEKDYITTHLNRRKSFLTHFTELEQLLKPKPGFKYSSVLKVAHEMIMRNQIHVKDREYFVVFKNAF